MSLRPLTELCSSEEVEELHHIKAFLQQVYKYVFLEWV